MKIWIVKTPVEGANEGVAMIQQTLKDRHEQAVFGLATGGTPQTLYRLLSACQLDFSRCIAINLDEYVGLDQENPQSYAYYMNRYLFSKKPFQQTFIPNGMNRNATVETQRYDQILDRYPIDLQILGLGQNGHIGFNEPGTPFESTTHEVQLTESTIAANVRFFAQSTDVPRSAYSMGIKSIMAAKQIIIMAYGKAKAAAVKKLVLRPVTTAVPASILQQHSNVTLIVDEAASDQIKKGKVEN